MCKIIIKNDKTPTKPVGFVGAIAVGQQFFIRLM